LQIFLKLYIFLIKKMDKTRKTPTEKEMLDQLREDRIQLPPLSFRFLDGRQDVGVNGRFDVFIEAFWKKSKATFAVECKALSTPKAFQDGVNLLKLAASICAATVWWLYRVNLPCFVVAERTVFPLRPLLKTFTGKTVLWWGGSFSSAPATKPFKRSVPRSTNEISW